MMTPPTSDSIQLLDDARNVDLTNVSQIPAGLQVENLRRRGIDILRISWSVPSRKKSWFAFLGRRARKSTLPFELTFHDNKVRIDAPDAKNEKHVTTLVPFADVKSVSICQIEDPSRSHIRLEAVSGDHILAACLSKDALKWLRDRILLETAGLAWHPIHNVGKRTTRQTTKPDEQAYLRWKAGPNKLIQLFLEHAPSRMTSLQTAVERGDLASVRQNAHWLKSSSAAVGAAYLSELLQRLEIDIDIKRSSEVASLASHIAKEFRQVTDALLKLETAADNDKSDAPHEQSEPAPVPQQTGTLSGLRILLVEDSLVNQEVARDCLETAGCTVTAASDGREAVSLASVHTYDVVLMDCQMSGMDGFRATKVIRQFEHRTGRAKTPIVALTAHALMGDRELCLTAGMDDYLSKPFAGDDLIAMVTKWAPAAEMPVEAASEEPSDEAAASDNADEAAQTDGGEETVAERSHEAA